MTIDPNSTPPNDDDATVYPFPKPEAESEPIGDAQDGDAAGKPAKPVKLRPAGDGEQRRAAIIPAPLGRSQIKQTAIDFVSLQGYRAGFHGFRSPVYAVGSVGYAARGMHRLGTRWGTWVAAPHLHMLMSEAVARGQSGHAQAMTAHAEGRRTRKARWQITGGVAAVAGVGALIVDQWAPGAVQDLLAAGAFGVLVHQGRPHGRPMLPAAILPPQYMVPTPELITEAFKSLGIPAIVKYIEKHGTLDWVSDVHRDGPGWAVEVDLPGGVKAETIVAKRKELSSSLKRPLSAVWPEGVPGEHEGRLYLWIGRQDMAKMKPPPYPFLKSGTADYFQPAPFAFTPRAVAVSESLFGKNWLIGGAPGNGKALALDTPVPTPSGWTTMGELQDGDTVFGADGKPCSVERAWPVRYDRPCYEVEFSDGTVITADAEHNWQVDTRASRQSAQRAARPRSEWAQFSRDQSHKRSMPAVMTTEDMLKSQRAEGGRANYSVRVAAPLAGTGRRLPVPPYTLGAWLGDGTTTGGQITSLDPDVITEIESEGEQCTRLTYPSMEGKCPQYKVAGLTTRLRKAGVLGDKHIPIAYLRAPESQRRALLAGLLDTDGYCQSTGVVYFGVKSERLARDVRHLVASLGYKATLTSKPARLYGKDCGTQWIVTFTPADKVFRLSRKVCRQIVKPRASAAHRYITAIREVPSVPVRCITVDSPDHLYLVTEACIPTHNTSAVRVLACFAALDPTVELWIHELLGKGDLDPFGVVAHRYCSGLDRESLQYAADSLANLRGEVDRRTEILKKIPLTERPDGSITREIGAKYGLTPLVAIFDEIHNLFLDEELGAKAAKDITHVIRSARALGVTVIAATQRPDKDAMPTNMSGIVTTRFCLKVPDWQSNDMILGTGSNHAGWSAVAFRQETDAGLGWLRGTADPRPVKTYYLTLPQTQKICARARALREAAGTLSGYALGEDGDDERSLIGDVRAVFASGERFLYWETVAKRLAQRFPGTYAGVAPAAVSADVRTTTGRESDEGREPGGANRSGIKLATIKAALTGTAAPPEPDAAELDLELVAAAAEFIITAKFCTSAMLQRKFRTGAAETGALLARLEEIGVIAAATDGEKARDVLKTPGELDEALQQIRGSVSV